MGRSKWQCPKCGWNKWHPRYRIDMALRHENAVLLLEFKRLRSDNVTDILSGANMELWRAKRCDAAADRALAGQGCMLNAAVCYHHTLKELEDSAQPVSELQIHIDCEGTEREGLHRGSLDAI